MFEEKLSKAIEEMNQAGIARHTHSPPVFRFMWRIGLNIRPLFYSNLASIFLFMGIGFATLYWMIKSLLFGSTSHIHPIATLVEVSIAGLGFGAFVALYYRWGRKKYGLSKWNQL